MKTTPSPSPSSGALPSLSFAQRLTLAAAFAVAVGAGFYVGRHGDAVGLAAASDKPADGAHASKTHSTGETAVKPNRQNLAAQLNALLSGGMDSLGVMRLSSFAAGLDAGSARALLDQLQSAAFMGKESYLRQQAQEALLARWTTLDPSAALDWAAQLPKMQDRANALRAVFGSWGAGDASPLVAALNQMPNQNLRRDLQNSLVEVLARQDPKTALEFLAQSPGTRQPYEYARVFEIWARQNPAAAAQAAQDLPPGNARNQALQNIASAWAEKDPASALQWAQTLPSGQVRNNVLTQAMDRLANSDPRSALKFLDDLPNNNQRRNLIFTVANSLAQQESPTAALAWAQSADISPQILQSVLPNILSQMAESDPAAAAAYVSQMPANAARQNAIANVASSWANADPAAALAWAESLPADTRNGRRNVLSSVVGTWANSDPKAAAAYLQSHLEDPGMAQIAGSIASQWAQSDPAAALQWASSLPNARAQGDAARIVLMDQANFDPQGVWNYLQQVPADDTRFKDMTQIVFDNWGREDPAQAATVITSLPDGRETQQAVTNLAGAWLGQDPLAASAWIATLPEGTSRDGAIGRLVTSQSAYDPDITFAWAMTIGDEALRTRNVRTAARELYRRDPALAQTVIAANFPADQTATLLQQAQTDSARGVRGGGNVGIMIDPVTMPRPMARDAAVLKLAASDGAVFSSGPYAGPADIGPPPEADITVAPMPYAGASGRAMTMEATATDLPATTMMAPAGGNFVGGSPGSVGGAAVRIGKPLIVPPPPKKSS